MNKTYFYKLDEVLDYDGTMDREQYATELASRFGIYFKTDKYSIADTLLSRVDEVFFEYYAYKKEFDWFDENPSIEEYDVVILGKRLANIFNLTCDRYIPLLKAVDKYKADITAPIESSSASKTRFNDTPQNEELEGDFNDDAHSTNYTSTSASSKTEYESIADKMDKLYKNWRDVYGDWIREFKGLFMEVFE